MNIPTIRPGQSVFLITFMMSFIIQVLTKEDTYYIKACYPWFRPPQDTKETLLNCTLGCSLHMPYVGVTQQEVALCLKDGRTAISCKSDSDCDFLMETARCKRAYCLCEEKGLDRFYNLIDTADTSAKFCAASAELHSIHIPLVLFPWKTLMIVFGTVALTGLLLMTLKWVLPIISTIRDYQNPESTIERLRTEEVLAEAFRSQAQQRLVATNDKPPSYETAIQLTDALPSYEDAQKDENQSTLISGENSNTNAQASAANDTNNSRSTELKDIEPLLTTATTSVNEQTNREVTVNNNTSA